MSGGDGTRLPNAGTKQAQTIRASRCNGWASFSPIYCPTREAVLDLIAILLSLIVAATGIPREADPSLTAIAQRRAVEIQTDFSHNGHPAGLAEIIAWNNSPDPAGTVLEQWRGSPPHWGILTDPRYGAIGCGHSMSPDGRHWFACVLAAGPSVEVIPTPVPAPSPVPTELPNTALEK